MAASPPDPRITEQRNPRTADIDLATPLEIVDLIAAEDRLVPAAVYGERDRIAAAIAEAERTFRRHGRLFYVGAGTSGRLGVLDASECPPTFGSEPMLLSCFNTSGVFGDPRGATADTGEKIITHVVAESLKLIDAWKARIK